MNLKKTFIIFILLLSTAPSYAIECSRLLTAYTSPDFAYFTSAPRKPKVGNRINPEGLSNWIKAHREFGADYVELASFLASHVEILPQSQFESLLKRSMGAFFKSIPRNKPYFIIIGEEKTKSQLWVAHLISSLVPHRKPEDIILNPTREVLESYIKKNPNSVPLMVDDASYMGQNLTESLWAIFDVNQDRGKQTVSLSSKPVEIHIVVAAVAQEASRSLNKFTGVFQHSSYHMPNISELLQSVPDPVKRSRLKTAFEKQYGDFTFDLVLTGFAHKTADMASVVGMSADETYAFARSRSPGESFSPRDTPHGSTVLEGVLLGPDNLYRDTIPVLNMEEKPYGN